MCSKSHHERCISMDEKDFSSAPGKSWGGGDTRYLQRELGKVLSAALAAVVQLQPSDPITVLALWLRNYREINPLPAISAAAGEFENSMYVEVAAVNNKSHDYSDCVIYKSSDIDFNGDHSVDLPGYLSLEDAVHGDIIPAVVEIGDLFDDDDIG